jgi:hypothetical protein
LPIVPLANGATVCRGVTARIQRALPTMKQLVIRAVLADDEVCRTVVLSDSVDVVHFDTVGKKPSKRSLGD